MKVCLEEIENTHDPPIKEKLNKHRPGITWFVTEKLESDFQVSISYRWMGFLFLFSCYSKIDSCQLHAPCLLKNDNHAIHGNTINWFCHFAIKTQTPLCMKELFIDFVTFLFIEVTWRIFGVSLNTMKLWNYPKSSGLFSFWNSYHIQNTFYIKYLQFLHAIKIV